jgi:energy-coupling factor transporter ATP-binding protein EcfA2
MMRRKHGAVPDIAADPFHEQVSQALHRRLRLLGGEFSFTSDSADLMDIVDWCYANLPCHQLPGEVPRLTLALSIGPRRPDIRADAPWIEMLSGADFLAATTRASNFVTLSPERRTGLIVVSERMLRFRYHVRYEMIEFAVFTLAARVQRLVPLHAGCIAREGRAILLMGDSGAGKSTATLHGLLHGLELIAEDSVFVSPESMAATGVANFLHVRRDSLRFLPGALAACVRQCPVIRRRSGVSKFEIDPRHPHFRDSFRVAAHAPRVAAVVFFASASVPGASRLHTLDSAELGRRLAAAQPYAAQRPEWHTFCRRMEELPGFVLHRGRHPESAAQALSGLLASGQRGPG